MTAPLVVSYGMGVDSTAVLVGFAARGIRPDAILFADVGGERPETYAYLEVINRWLASVGFPLVTIVRYTPKRAPYRDLEGNCLCNRTMPGLAFGRKSCSQKWKGQPLDAHVRKLFAAELAAGVQIDRVIGYDCGPKDARRGKQEDTAEFHWWFPLRDWGWDREECKRQIAAAGLPVPIKSCCFFCPAMKPAELLDLADRHPDLALRAVAIEDGAQGRQEERRAEGKKAIEGLWGRGTKGLRKGVEAKPGRWREYLETQRPGLFAAERGEEVA